MLDHLIKEYFDHCVWLYLRLRYGHRWMWYWMNYQHTGEILW